MLVSLQPRHTRSSTGSGSSSSKRTENIGQCPSMRKTAMHSYANFFRAAGVGVLFIHALWVAMPELVARSELGAFIHSSKV